jgi:hypothetical protein
MRLSAFVPIDPEVSQLIPFRGVHSFVRQLNQLLP